jgi:two-component system nitrogen regulation response regulator NtrX
MAVVLVVEDEDSLRVLAKSCLESLGHAALSARSSEEALALLEKTPHLDLLFVDLQLQDEDDAGIEFVDYARKLRPNLRVVYTSGRVLTDGMKARFARGSVFLNKPYTVDQLTAVIEKQFSQPESDVLA